MIASGVFTSDEKMRSRLRSQDNAAAYATGAEIVERLLRRVERSRLDWRRLDLSFARERHEFPKLGQRAGEDANKAHGF